MAEFLRLNFSPVVRDCCVGSSRNSGRAHPCGAEILPDSTEYFGARACGQEPFVNHLVKHGLNDEHAERPCDAESGFEFDHVGFQVGYSLVGGKHLTSPVAAPVATVAEAAGESILGGGGLF